jgi:hypothetical protein
MLEWTLKDGVIGGVQVEGTDVHKEVVDEFASFILELFIACGADGLVFVGL